MRDARRLGPHYGYQLTTNYESVSFALPQWPSGPYCAGISGQVSIPSSMASLRKCKSVLVGHRVLRLDENLRHATCQMRIHVTMKKESLYR